MKRVKKLLKFQGAFDAMGYGMYALRTKFWEQRSISSKLVEDFLAKNYPKYKFSKTNYKNNLKEYEKNYQKSAKEYIINPRLANMLQVEKNDEGYLLFKVENATESMLYFYGSGFWTDINPFQLYFLRALANILKINIIVPIIKSAPYYSYLDVERDLIRISELFKAEINYLSGDGTGATLLYNCLNTKHFAKEKIKKIILFSPIVNLDLDTSVVNKEDPIIDPYSLSIQIEYFFSKDQQLIQRYNPMSFTLDNYPQTHIFAGTKDTLYNDILAFSNKQIEAKNDLTLHTYKQMIHLFNLFPIAETKEVFKTLEDIFNIKHQEIEADTNKE